MRDGRLKKRATAADAAVRHVGLARPVVISLAVACALGVTSAVVVRGFAPLASLHGWLGLVATLGFGGTLFIGSSLVKGRTQRRGLHLACSLLGLGTGLVCAITGIELLP